MLVATRFRYHGEQLINLVLARTPAGGAADEATFEDALAGTLLKADGELHGRSDAVTVSQRRALDALAGGEAQRERLACAF